MVPLAAALLMASTTLAAPALAGERAPALDAALSAEERAWLERHPSIRVGFDPRFPPYSFRSSAGELEGFAVDMLSLLAGRLGVALDVRAEGTWDQLYRAAAAREVDAVATMVRRPEREALFGFTAPYIFKSLVIMTRVDGARVATREDLPGKTVALVKSYQYVTAFLAENPTAKPLFVDTMLDALNAVGTGEADCAITFFGGGYYLQTKYTLTNLRFAFVYDRHSAVESIGVRKDWPLLISVLDKALATVSDAERLALNRRWLPPEHLADDALPLLLTTDERRWIAAHPVIRLGVDPEFHPFEFIDADGRYRGIAADYLEMLGDRLGLRFDVPSKPSWPAMIEAAKQRRIDLLPAVGATAERRRFLRFTKPYVSFHRVIVTRLDMPFLAGLEDLAGLRVAVQADSSHDGFLRERSTLEPLRYPTLQETLLAVADGEADAMIGNLASAAYRIRQLHLTNLKVAAAAGHDVQGIHFAVRSDWPELATILDKGIDSIGSRQQDEISRRWVVLQFAPETDYGPLVLVLLAAGAIMLLVLLWNLQVRRHRRRSQAAWAEAEAARAEAEAANESLRQLSAELEDLVEQRSAELRQAQDRFYQAQKLEALGTLVGGLAHDFNNILGAMLGAIELAQRNIRDGDAEELLSMARDVGRQGADMITQLLAFARQQQVDKAQLSVTRLIDSVRELARPALPKTIDFEVDVAVGDARIEGNLALLQQALLNLLTNARDAVGSVTSPRIELRVATLRPDPSLRALQPELEEGEYLAIEVVDNGDGVPTEHLDRLFDPFFSTKPPGEGTGLGLPMVYGTVHDHQGVVWAESEPGAGTSFHVLLPVLGEGVGVVADAEDVLVAGAGETLLVAEDDPQLRELYRRLLTELGYDVVSARDGVEALERFRHDPTSIDLAVLDVVMPGIDGVATATALRRIDPSVGIVFLTGHDAHGALAWSRDHARAAVLRKPSAVGDLSRTVRDILEAGG